MGRLGFESDEPSDITKDRWIQAQRDLITTTLDYNLQTVADLVTDGRIDLSPSFQRRDRWDIKRRSLLIESFLMNVPLPPVFLNEDEYGQYSIIDGKQRLTTISDFLKNDFALEGLTIFHEANGLTFRQLDPALRSVLQTRASIRAIILLRLSDPLIKYHVFQRLNTGGVRLNAQEVRNVTFAGALNDAIVGAASYPPYRKLLHITDRNQTKSSLWRQMRDVELILRYLTLQESWQNFSGSLGGAMNTFMFEHQHASIKERDDLIADFHSAVNKVSSAFGETAFRRINPSTGSMGTQVLATLFDAQMTAVRDMAMEDLENNRPKLREGMTRLFSDEMFSKSIGAQTNTPSYVKTRIHMTQIMVHEAVAH